MKRRNRIVMGALIIIMLIFTGAVAFSGYRLYEIYSMYKQADEVNDRLRIYKPTESTEPTEDTPLTDKTDNHIEQGNPSITQLINKYSGGCGWLTVNDTPIDYCFAQAEDNEYYLTRDISGEYLKSGTLFLDYRCEKDLSGANSIIFGHNMKNGTMFGSLPGFADKDYFDSHTEGTVYLADKTYDLQIFAYLIVDSRDKIVYDPYITTEDYISYIKKQAMYYNNISIGSDDRLLTLSTCNYSFDGARSVLVGKLILKTQNKQK